MVAMTLGAKTSAEILTCHMSSRCSMKNLGFDFTREWVPALLHLRISLALTLSITSRILNLQHAVAALDSCTVNCNLHGNTPSRVDTANDVSPWETLLLAEVRLRGKTAWSLRGAAGAADAQTRT